MKSSFLINNVQKFLNWLASYIHCTTYKIIAHKAIQGNDNNFEIV